MNSPIKRILICFILFFCIAVGFVGLEVCRLYYWPLSNDHSKNVLPIRLLIDKSTSASAFVNLLQSRKFIQSKRIFLYYIRLRGLSHQLKAGLYQIEPGETAVHFLNRVIAGDVIKKSFRIVDGTTQRQVAADLAAAEELIYKASDWNAVKSSNESVEGLLLADTYYYDAGSSAKDLLGRVHKNLLHFLDYSWQHRSAGVPYKTPYELLIVASIVEKEAALPREKRLIAGVIINRLSKKIPLQMDPTVIYALGSDYKGKLTRADLQVDSPFNTYRYRGLPPTPIAMVGKDAIDAAAHPEFSDYLYFVATGDGRHTFSVNYEQQKRAVARYRELNDK